MKTQQPRGTGGAKRQSLPDDPEQSKRFEETAREIGVDESGRIFEAALGILKNTNEKAPPPAKPETGRKVKK